MPVRNRLQQLSPHPLRPQPRALLLTGRAEASTGRSGPCSLAKRSSYTRRNSSMCWRTRRNRGDASGFRGRQDRGQISTPPLAPAGETGPSLKGHARSGGRAELAVYEASRSDQVHLALVVSPATGVPARSWKTPVAARWSPSAVAHTRTGWRRSGQDGRRQADPPRRGRQPRPRRRHAGAIPVLSRVPLPKRLSWTPPTRAGTRLYLRDRVETLALDPGAVEPPQRRKPPRR